MPAQCAAESGSKKERPDTVQCIKPIKSSLNNKGERTYKQSEMMQGLLPVQFQCRKCLPCRLNIAREKAIRAVHEAKMHKNNIFLTLTYDTEHLVSSELQYIDFQLFIMRLREKVTRNITDKETRDKLFIPYMVTGEYGEKNKRPHWHAIIFNYRPPDETPKYKTQREEQVYTSQLLLDLWGKGLVEYGSVTMDSAGYVARYAAKKLIHGLDQEHNFHPIHKTSSKHAIGKSWIEKYHEFTFNHGYIVLPNGTLASVPRYYTDWFKKNHPESYNRYVTEIQPKAQAIAEAKNRKEELEYHAQLWSKPHGAQNPLTRAQVKLTILKTKFKQLQERLKL